MEQSTAHFEEYNEADVREEIIAPLLRRLGYRSGTDNNIIRELPLRYPKLFIGRRNPLKDPELRGIADYVLEVGRLIRWVVEAKAPAVALGSNEIEQAWSYANHPEVRAVYFALCNGRSFQVYQTNHGPEAKPLLCLASPDLHDKYDQIASILSPGAVLTAFPTQTIDINPPLGPGLRSVSRITSGWIRYEQNTLGSVALNQIQIIIRCGAVQRDEKGKLIAHIETVAPLRILQELYEKLGLTSFEMVSNDSALSTDASNPTEFVNSQRIIFPAGEKLLDLNTWTEIPLQSNVACETATRALGSLRGHVFTGRLFVTIRIQCPQILDAEAEGPFHVDLA